MRAQQGSNEDLVANLAGSATSLLALPDEALVQIVTRVSTFAVNDEVSGTVDSDLMAVSQVRCFLLRREVWPVCFVYLQEKSAPDHTVRVQAAYRDVQTFHCAKDDG